MSLVVKLGWLEQVDRGADNPISYIPIMKPVSEANARSRAVAPLKEEEEANKLA
jgi:hypothetical protein